MIEEEIPSEVIEEEDKSEETIDYSGEEDTGIGSINPSEIELFLFRAEIWDELLQDRMTISEASNLFSSFKQSLETPKEISRKSRRRRT